MSRKRYLEVLVCIVIVAVGVLSVFLARSRAAYSSSERNTSDPEVPVVEYIRITPQTLEDRLRLTGSVAPWKEVTLSAEVGGKIESRFAEEGESVKAGQELFHINTQVLQARLAQARAQARLSSQEFQRAQRLATKGVSAERDLDSAVASKEVAEAEVKTLEIQLAKSVVRAPFDAVVDRCFKEPNEYTDVGAPLIRLVQLDTVKVEVNVPERDVPAFKVDDLVHVAVDAYAGESFTGRIHRIATSAEMGTRTFRTEIEIKNENLKLRPGMIARVDLIRGIYPESIVVPIFSTFLLDQQRYVAVVENGLARVRPVETGIVQGGTVQITRGLSEGDLLIVKGQFDVRDGAPVNAREASV